MTADDAHEDNTSRGVALIVGAVFLLALADALVKYLSASITLWQLYVLASSVSLPTLAGLIIAQRKTRPLSPTSWRWVGIRSLLLLLMWVAYYMALPLIPLSVAAVAIYTTPLFIAILASMGAREPLSPIIWGGILCGFIGVVVVLRPTGDAYTPATLLPVMAAVLYALAMVATRRYCQKEHPLTLALGLNLAFLVAGGGVSILLAFTDTSSLAEQSPFLFASWQPIGRDELIIIVAYALLMVAVNTSVAKAYQVAPSALIGTFDYAYLLFVSLWGYLLFHEVPDAMTWLGMSLILASGLLVLRRQRRPSR
ncbi:DMT family transporter [Halomonas organivorans]|uniref:Drug/metabolite transporter (DMT)-like permease n=1 Tax=Halomonas organivorans TaxID=257772 RepID=A0A7W5BYL3_9GAMM|nr:DMT family transporter [Halomonas organivorans]MBB3141551.1 drug/metabolite transporter (DMT)-like permease [Halomonas organivorans]